jgi:prepilin-type N-terminal cleavage/methylation domain-containing protein
MMRRQAISRQDGFTLIEVLVAAVILGFALGSVLTISSHAFVYLNDIRRTARSSQVLQQKIEDIRLWNWSQLQSAPLTFSDTNIGVNYQGWITTNSYDTYLGSTTVMRVTLFVTWTNSNRRPMTNTLSTLISNGGLNKYIF